MTERTTRVTVLNESLYGEDNTLAGWQEWLRERFEKVPSEYRDSAVLEIDSVGGYEGEHHTEATLYYDRPETAAERQNRHAREQARADEEEQLAARRLADAQARRARLAAERQ
jgi:hypothetical protein